MSESNDKRPSIRLSSLFITFPDSLSFSDNSKSPKSPFDIKKSPRNFEGGVVGLGIVAAMNENSDTHEVIFAAISNRTAKTAFSPRSVPIPIVSGKTSTKSKGPISEKDEMELSESYTCVISHVGNESIRKHEYFEMTDGMVGNYCENSGGFYTSLPKYTERAAAVPVADFLNSCHLCMKKLEGLDIFMYRGDKAFCSAECRRQQILSDEEHKPKCGSETLKSLDYSCSPCSAEKCGSEASKSLDYSCSPCSAPGIFSAGVAAA